jgi:hypothetical protein
MEYSVVGSSKEFKYIPVYKKKSYSSRYKRSKFQMYVLRHPRLFPKVVRQWANYRFIRIGESPNNIVTMKITKLQRRILCMD